MNYIVLLNEYHVLNVVNSTIYNFVISLLYEELLFLYIFTLNIKCIPNPIIVDKQGIWYIPDDWFLYTNIRVKFYKHIIVTLKYISVKRIWGPLLYHSYLNSKRPTANIHHIILIKINEII